MKLNLIKKIIYVILSFMIAQMFLTAQEEEEHLYILQEEIPIVGTSLLMDVNLTETPGSMTVITKQDIELNGWKSLVEVFRSVVGFDLFINDLTDSGPTVRGVYSASYLWIKLLVNNHPVNGGFYSSTFNHQYFNLFNVKQIEIIRGPGSALYGTSAFTAVINIITDKEEGAEVDVSYGQYDYGRIGISYNSPQMNDFKISIFGDVWDYEGDDFVQQYGVLFQTPFRRGPKAVKREQKRREINTIITYKKLALTYDYADYESNHLQGVTGTLTEDGVQDDHKFYFFELKFDHEFGDNLNLTFKSSLDRDYIDFTGQLFPNGFTFMQDINGDGLIEFWPNGARTNSSVVTTKQNNELILQKQIYKHNLLFGVFFEKKKMHDITYFANFHHLYLFAYPQVIAFPAGQQWIASEADDDIYGGFFQDVYNINELWALTLGVRYDNYSDWGDSINPRAALVGSINDNFIVKFHYGEAFAAPSYAAQYTINSVYSGNVNIKPEDIQNYEISVQNLESQKLHYNLTVFSMDIKDYQGIVTNPLTGGSVLQNRGDIESKGIELEIAYNPLETIRLFGHYSYADTFDSVTQRKFKNSAESKGNIGMTYEFLNNWFLTSRLFISSKRAGNIEVGISDLPGYELLDINVVGQINSHLTLTLNSTNVLDEEYEIGTEIPGTSNVPMPGREMRMSLNYKF